MDLQFTNAAVEFSARMVADQEDALARVIRKKERILTDDIAAVDVQILEAQEKLIAAQAELEVWKAQLEPVAAPVAEDVVVEGGEV